MACFSGCSYCLQRYSIINYYLISYASCLASPDVQCLFVDVQYCYIDAGYIHKAPSEAEGWRAGSGGWPNHDIPTCSSHGVMVDCWCVYKIPEEVDQEAVDDDPTILIYWRTDPEIQHCAHLHGSPVVLGIQLHFQFGCYCGVLLCMASCCSRRCQVIIVVFAIALTLYRP